MPGKDTKRKRELQKQVNQVEKQIFDLESTYLDETKEFGNIFTGWEHFYSTQKVKVRKAVANDERYFSLSSVTSLASRKTKYKQAATKDPAKAAKKRKRVKGMKQQETNLNSTEPLSPTTG